MQVTFQPAQGVTVTPSGLFDYSAGQDCIPKVESILREEGAVQLTVDFSLTTGIDSSGVGALLILLDKMPSAAPPVRLINPTRPVQRILRLCHLDYLFEITACPRQS